MRPLADSSAAHGPPLHHSTEKGLGWNENGDLIRLAESEFDLFITSDQSIRYQQNLTGRKISILELSTNKRRRIEAAAGVLLEVVNSMDRSEFRSLLIP